ncbi:hypothetical protein [Streptomyces sp. NPDC085540]|uniref:hypothetical protein n=1 Tax=Streptomyces sp. NPDC085540 TaxID=3365730 RepID=UPI0037D757F5
MTLVTGDRILVSTDAAGRTAATAMPRADGSPAARTDGTGGAPLVDAGSGSPDELAAAGAEGAVVLVKAADAALHEVAQNARAAGARAVLAHRGAPGRWTACTGYAGGALPRAGPGRR